jgi:hypothetical protein
MFRKSVLLTIIYITVTSYLLGGFCAAQALQPALESTIEVLRADLRADKITVIAEAMRFSGEDAAIFWPLYNKYELELSKLEDQRARVIKEYAEKYPTLSDADAKAMAETMFDYNARVTKLKKKYFKEFNKMLRPLTVVKFFQIEHRLDLLVDLKLASELPSLVVRPDPGSETEEEE